MKRIIRLFLVAALSLTAIAGVASPASAATANVNITIGDWNCRQDGAYKGSVSKVLVDAIPSYSGQPGWIGGKTRYGVNVGYNYTYGSSVKVTAVIFCKTTWYGAGYYRELVFGKWAYRGMSTDWTF